MNRAQVLSAELTRVDKVDPTAGSAKHRKMALSPYLFFRGSAQLFYTDIHNRLINLPQPLLDIPLTAVMGDCHTSNFGFLTEEGSHGDKVIFAPNDFDDACMGHAVWDLIRYLCSLQLVFVHCKGLIEGEITDTDFSQEKPVISMQHVELAMDAFLNEYTKTCLRASQSNDYLYHAIETIDPETKLYRFYRKALRRAAGGSDFLTKSALAKAVTPIAGLLSFKTLPEKFATLPEAQYQELERVFSPYMDDVVLDIVARLNAGTGSVNMQRYYFLVGPKIPCTDTTFARSHIVEVKKQRHAAPLFHFAHLHPVNGLNPAHLTARCQRRMQRRADLLLDEVFWNDAHWLVRSRHHAKVGIDPIDIGVGKKNVNGSFARYAEYCGRALALAHCRSDRRSTEFEAAIVDTLPSYAESLKDAAFNYTEQVVKDTDWLKQTVK